MKSTAIDKWKQRYLLEFFSFIRSPEVRKEVIPYMLESSSVSTISKVDMTKKLKSLMNAYGLSDTCYEAVIYYFLNYPPDIKEVVKLIEPINIVVADNGEVSITIANKTTQSDLEEFIRLKYAKIVKPNTKRLHIKSKLQETLIIDKRINKGKSYRQIQAEIDEQYDQWKEDANLRTIIANYNKRIK